MTGVAEAGAPAAGVVLDSLGMFAATAALPEQVAAAAAVARGLDGLPDHEYVEQVVVLGMGGSGIAGDLMVAVAGPFLPVPVVVVKSYDLPDFVGPGSLVFALSFSGDTEETVEAAGEAAGAGANVVAVTSGGELARLAEEWGAPCGPVPGDIPQPAGRPRRHGHPPADRPGGDRPLPRGASRWVELAVEQLRRRRDTLLGARQPGRGAGPDHRPDHPPRPRGPGPRGGRRAALEDPGQRERQVAGLLRPSIPSSATTRSPAGARTATSPARS